LETGRAAIKIGATMRHVNELAAAVAEAYRTEKNREIDPKVQLAIRKNLIAFADQPVGEKQTERVATIASELKVSPPDFDNSASASHWVMKHSPESHEMLANYAETIEARVTRQAKLNFQLDPANPQQQAGLLMAEWMMQTAHLAQLQSNQASPQFIEQNRIERQAQNAYLMAADRHEAHYGLEPHAILTEEQHAYLQEHKSSLDSYPHEALSSAIISDVSPANAPLGKEPEISYDESPSIDM